MAERGTCDGTDRHCLSLSPRGKAVFCAVAAVLLLLAIASGSGVFITYGAGLAFVAALSAGYSLRLDGDSLVSRRYGTTKRTPLSTINRVERYTYRGGTSLRTWRADGGRGPSVPVSTPIFRLDPKAAGHLLRYLDRTDVTWGPDAWELLAGGSSRPTPAPLSDPGTAAIMEPVGSPGPKGVELPVKPLSRAKRIIGWISVGAVVLAAAVFIVLTPVAWTKYAESQRIQHGPEVSAVLRSEWITQYSDRSGTHHTTHFDVTFLTLEQQLVTTEVVAPGSWTMEPPGDRLSVRYDPTFPRDAELPGAPNNTLAGAIVPTVGAVLLPGFSVATLVGIRRARRRANVTR